ncbi:MAG: Holliday junction branch migration protein RuvA [Bacilli bacterium]|nr:Holliday junction branch migration protein RuvA [Bacilli bacterium]
MYEYLKGNITKQIANYIVIDVNGIGYKVFTPNPYSFKDTNNITVFVYNHVREEENSLYGFKTEEERDLFLRLIDVKGLGPKMAITILASCSLNGLIDAIDRENILYLKKIPKVGEKLARQIILDLKGKLASIENENIESDELSLALESLGYKTNDIKNVVGKVDRDLPIENQIKEALKLLLK